VGRLGTGGRLGSHRRHLKDMRPRPPLILLPFLPCWEKMYVCSVLDNGVHVSAFTSCSVLQCTSTMFSFISGIVSIRTSTMHTVALNLLVKLLYGNGVLLWVD
jgi:hypothetical protein